MEIMEVVVFICRTEKSQGIVTAQIEQETMRVTSPDFLRPASIYRSQLQSFIQLWKRVLRPV